MTSNFGTETSRPTQTHGVLGLGIGMAFVMCTQCRTTHTHVHWTKLQRPSRTECPGLGTLIGSDIGTLLSDRV